MVNNEYPDFLWHRSRFLFYHDVVETKTMQTREAARTKWQQ